MAIWNEVVSLVQDLDQLLSSYTHFFGRKLCCLLLTEEEHRILGVIVCLMESLHVQNRNHGFMNQILENRIKLVAQEAGNYIEFGTPRSRRDQFEVRTVFDSSGPRLSRIPQKILSINEELKKIHDQRNVQECLELTASSTGYSDVEVSNQICPAPRHRQPLCNSSTVLSPSRRTPIAEGKLVGHEKDLVTMLDNLTGHPLQVKVFPIIGMAGIGKTTFSKKLYDNPLIMHHFYVRAWVTVSQQYQLKDLCGRNLPPELVTIGHQIACKCQGLPLAIVVVGGLLSKMDRRLDVWEEVAQSVGSLVLGEADHCKNILALSYNHLPDHLKVCFLYMGIFPEDYEISVKKLIWLWVAEGFIRPSMIKGLEEVAEGYLEDLTARSLILVKRKSSNGRIKTCYIHDLMRELCLHECQREKILHVINSGGQVPQNYLHNLRRISFHSSFREHINGTSLPYTCSVFCFEKLSFSDHRKHLRMDLKLLKVLDIMNIHLMEIPIEIQDLNLLKFLALTIQNFFHMKFICMFRCLQTLILDCD
ncbi:UNVERIFIED_CONTAM: putative late blight resistance proteinR1A-10 [Sesamum calycinum]|uniref:Late blight resistance proteinR1A-10 n=1 Tax=Sesamum calycinum TaxID=2727403 RepID=A0AAW2PQ02_9LAMI